MWLLQPAQGRVSIKHMWRDWLRAVPDYMIDITAVAAQPSTNDAFVMWRASGMARLPLVRNKPTTNKPFEHHGVTRLRFSADGRIEDQWTWRGATSDEAEHLLARPPRRFDLYAPRRPAPAPPQLPGAHFASADDLSHSHASGRAGPAGAAAAAAQHACRAAGATFRLVFGAAPGSDVTLLSDVLTDDYTCEEATGVWRSLNLSGRDACAAYCERRAAELEGTPRWHADAVTPDGKVLFAHFQNVLSSRRSGTVVGLSSGVLVHLFDDAQRIQRTLMFRGPMGISERAEYFEMSGTSATAPTAAACAMPGVGGPVPLPCLSGI